VPRSASWAVEAVRGSAGSFHARELLDVPHRAIWSSDVDRPALVLGSTQSEAVVDHAACAARGVEIVRRRSGGAAVYLAPDEVAWVDVVVPRGDALWDDDVGRAAWWLGEAFVAALAPGRATVHRGAMVRGPWSHLVCFAGIGPGEVTVGARKLVGISQRRTRGGARFQCAVHRRFDAVAMRDCLAAPRPEADELDALVATAPFDLDRLVAAIERS
jgi:lipoate-protein ligase A